jgi:hypothetical protein
LLSRALIASTRAGRIALPSFQAQVDLRVQGGSRRRDPFDSFFDFDADSFFGRNTVKATLPTRELALEVRPLPAEGRPEDFTGLVGDFRVSASLGKDSVKEYDLVNLTVKVEGEGAIGSVPEPRLDQIEGIAVYESKGATSLNADKTGGAKTFQVVIQPTHPGRREIPPIGYAFFNPTTERYETVRSEPLTLTVAADPTRQQGLMVVAPLADSGVESRNGSANVRVLHTGLRPLRADTPLRAFREAPLHARGGFWAAQLIPPLLLLACAWAAAHRRRLATDEAFARSRGAKERASRRLKGAARAFAKGDAGAFYQEVGAALRGLVADRCSLAAAGATNDDLHQAVASKTRDGDLADQLVRQLEVCDAARFAPGAASGEIETHWTESKRLTRELERRLR